MTNLTFPDEVNFDKLEPGDKFVCSLVYAHDVCEELEKRGIKAKMRLPMVSARESAKSPRVLVEVIEREKL